MQRIELIEHGNVSSAVSVPSCSHSYNITSDLQSIFTAQEVICLTCSLPGGLLVRSWTINGTSAIGLPGVTALYNGALLIEDPLALLLGPTNSLSIQCFDETKTITYATYLGFGGKLTLSYHKYTDKHKSTDECITHLQSFLPLQ